MDAEHNKWFIWNYNQQKHANFDYAMNENVKLVQWWLRIVN